MVNVEKSAAFQDSDIRGVVVQEIPNVSAIQSFQGDDDVELAHGVLRVLLVSVDVDDPFRDDAKVPSGKGSLEKEPATDIWVVLEIEDRFSLPIKASQRITPERSTSSYILPSADIPGASIRLQLLDSQGVDVHFLEEILSEYCAFQDDAPAGKGAIELLDDRGELLGTIDGPWQLKEDPKMQAAGHEKDPVLLELPDEKAEYKADEAITVTTVPRDESGNLSKQYEDDWLLKGADFISRTVVRGSTWAGEKMIGAADSYIAKSTPASSSDDEKAIQRSNTDMSTATRASTTSGRPSMTFNPQIHKGAERLNRFGGGAARVSNQTRDAILSVASGVGDQIGKKTGIQAKPRADGQPGEPPKGFRGAINRSLIAANVVLDGIFQSTDTLVRDGGQASSRVIEHRYGSEAKVVSGNTAAIGRSAYVIYKDINGVRRKALLRIATGTIVAKAPDGSQIVLQQQNQSDSSAITNHASGSGSHSPAPPGYEDLKYEQYKGKDMEKR